MAYRGQLPISRSHFKNLFRPKLYTPAGRREKALNLGELCLKPLGSWPQPVVEHCQNHRKRRRLDQSNPNCLTGQIKTSGTYCELVGPSENSVTLHNKKATNQIQLFIVRVSSRFFSAQVTVGGLPTACGNEHRQREGPLEGSVESGGLRTTLLKKASLSFFI